MKLGLPMVLFLSCRNRQQDLEGYECGDGTRGRREVDGHGASVVVRPEPSELEISHPVKEVVSRRLDLLVVVGGSPTPSLPVHIWPKRTVVYLSPWYRWMTARDRSPVWKDTTIHDTFHGPTVEVVRTGEWVATLPTSRSTSPGSGPLGST